MNGIFLLIIIGFIGLIIIAVGNTFKVHKHNSLLYKKLGRQTYYWLTEESETAQFYSVKNDFADLLKGSYIFIKVIKNRFMENLKNK